MRALTSTVIVASLLIGALAGGPQIRVLNGHIPIQELTRLTTTTSYQAGQQYTFEVYLDNPQDQDYYIEECYMNGKKFIDQFGCVICSQCVLQSVETESYNKRGAVKRTLVYFIAQETDIQFSCNVRQLECSGCAERSCQRRFQIASDNYVHAPITLQWPPVAASHSYPVVPANRGGGAAAYANGKGWPWWLWLLLLLLLLLLLCCCLALCLAAWLKKRKQMKKTTTIAVADTQCGTEKVAVTCVSTDTEDIHKITPAVIVGEGADAYDAKHNSRSYNAYGNESSRVYGAAGAAGAAAGSAGSYSVREGRVSEGFTRTVPQELYVGAAGGRYAANGYRTYGDAANNRSSYRNFAYERDLGRVEPLDGFDEVETRERTYCLSDDEQEVLEKDVKRTHTTRFIQETIQYDGSSDDERYREEEHQHASYTSSLPV